MKSVNKVIMIGNLTRDPELVTISANAEVAKFTLAVNESYKKQDGEIQEITTFIDCEAWGGLTKVVSNYLKKGSKLYIEGALRSDTWVDADTGKNRTKFKIRVMDLVMLDSRGSGSSDYSNSNESVSKVSDEGDASPVKSVEDNELPF